MAGTQAPHSNRPHVHHERRSNWWKWLVALVALVAIGWAVQEWMEEGGYGGRNTTAERADTRSAPSR